MGVNQHRSHQETFFVYLFFFSDKKEEEWFENRKTTPPPKKKKYLTSLLGARSIQKLAKILKIWSAPITGFINVSKIWIPFGSSHDWNLWMSNDKKSANLGLVNPSESLLKEVSY